jgi:hypothetical protein
MLLRSEKILFATSKLCKNIAAVGSLFRIKEGKTQYNHGNTYSATPSREDLLKLIHIIAVNDWDYAHADHCIRI